MASKTYLFFHLVLTPKYRREWLHDWTYALIAYCVATICRVKKDAHLMAMNIGPKADHVHLLVCLPPDVALAAFIRDVKSMSARFINAQRGTTGSPFWGVGYFARTVGTGSLEAAQRYVETQWNEDTTKTPPQDPDAISASLDADL